MPLILKRMRYAHVKGHTRVCYMDGEEGGLITSGENGQVRMWEDLGDEKCQEFDVTKSSTSAITFKSGKIYFGSDKMVYVVDCQSPKERDLFTRFSSDVSTLACSSRSSFILSGSSTGQINVIRADRTERFRLIGHNGPVLGLSIDPKEQYVASSSGDGTIKVWCMRDRLEVHTWRNIVPIASSISTAKIYGTPSFETQTGQLLAYPHEKDVIVVERSTWEESFRLSSNNVEHAINICKFSQCSKYIAASSVCGEIVVWDVQTKVDIGYVEHESFSNITSLIWNLKKSTELYFCDEYGRLGAVIVKCSSDDKNEINALRRKLFECQLELLQTHTNTLQIAVEYMDIARKKNDCILDETKIFAKTKKECQEKVQIMQSEFSCLDTEEQIELLQQASSAYHQLDTKANEFFKLK